MRGKLICCEGGDGAGKATQTKLLAERLNGHRIAFPRYETPVGAEILRNLKGEWAPADGSTLAGEWVEDKCAPLVRQALFTFDRYLAAAEIESKLAAGIHVVADRYWVSGVIFGASDGLDAKMLENVHARLPQPDLWLLLDVSPEESIKRRPDRRDMYEKDTKAAWRREAYLKFFSHRSSFVHKFSCPQSPCECDVRKWITVDGARGVDEVFADICAKVRGHFGRDVLDDMDLIKKGAK